jgi:hypothetical protein
VVSRDIPPIPPVPAVFNQRVVDVRSVQQEHVSKGAPVLVETVRLERVFLRKARSEAACLALVSYTTHCSSWSHQGSSNALRVSDVIA